MARPFGEENEAVQKEVQANTCNKYLEKDKLNDATSKNKNEKKESFKKFSVKKDSIHINEDDCNTSGHDEKCQISTTVFCISNSNFVNCGPTFINIKDQRPSVNRRMKSDILPCEPNQTHSRVLKVRKGVFESKRNVTSDDIKLISQDIGKDWKHLVTKLAGVNSFSSKFHQSLIDAMETNDDASLAEVALLKWKELYPELSTVGNLAKTLFKIDHPDIVAVLKP